MNDDLTPTFVGRGETTVRFQETSVSLEVVTSR